MIERSKYRNALSFILVGGVTVLYALHLKFSSEMLGGDVTRFPTENQETIDSVIQAKIDSISNE